MNAPTEVSNAMVSASGPVDAPTDATDWWPWLTGGVTQAWESLSRMTAAWWSASPSDPRILDLGVLDEGTQVRSRNFGDTMLVEVVSADNTVLSRYHPESASIDAVRVGFDCGADPYDVPISQFDDSHVNYINGAYLPPSSTRCSVFAEGVFVPSDKPFLPAQMNQTAVI